MSNLPSLFLAHGAPDLPLKPHVARDFLAELGDHLPKPRGILVISAHWAAPVPTLTSAEKPGTVHDFSGWPAELYKITYPARTNERFVQDIQNTLSAHEITYSTDHVRGFDHGAWVPLLISYPKADVPVVQLSLVSGTGPKAHFELGQALADLRKSGVLIIGSGATVHNLYALMKEGTPPASWALAFDAWLSDSLTRRDLSDLLAFPRVPDSASMAHPTIEHFLPLYVAMGAGWEAGSSRRIHHSYSYGSIGMSCYAFGERDAVELFDRGMAA